MDAFARIANARIEAAIARGEFDDLPGNGKPLPADELASVPAHLRMGLRILRNAGCLPPALEARKESARLGALIATAGSEEERTRLSRLRADAELRYLILAERRRR
jgi:hypothetical protein